MEFIAGVQKGGDNGSRNRLSLQEDPSPYPLLRDNYRWISGIHKGQDQRIVHIPMDPNRIIGPESEKFFPGKGF